MVSCKSATLAVLLTAAAALPAQPGRYTFRELENRILQHDASILAGQELLQAARSKVSAIRTLAWPELTSFYRYYPDGPDLTDYEFSVGHWLSVRLGKDIFDLFRRSGRINTGEAEAELARARLRQSARAALFDFRSAYLDMLAARSQVEYYEKLADIHQQWLAVAETRRRHRETLRTELLQVEREYLNFKALLELHRGRLPKLRSLISEWSRLDEAEIAWDGMTLQQVQIDKPTLLRLARENSDEVAAQAAKAQINSGQARAAQYDGLRLSPFLGFRLRTGRFSTVKTGPEVGIHFSMPLAYFSLRKQKSSQFAARANARKLAAEQTALELSRKTAQVHDRYQLAAIRLAYAQKTLEIRREELRVERTKTAAGFGKAKGRSAAQFKLESELLKTELQLRLQRYERDRLYYELLYLTGYDWPEDLVRTLMRQTTPGLRQAIWVWQTEALAGTPDAGTGLSGFCREQGIDEVYLSFNAAVREPPQRAGLQSLVQTLRAAEIRVSALLGDPAWVLDDKRANLLRKVEAVLSYNASVGEPSRFDALHLDIEPHTLPAWQEKQRELLHKLAQALGQVKSLLTDRGAALTLEVDLPAFYGKLDSATVKKILNAADTVTIMAYDKTEAGKLLKSLSKIKALAEAANKPFLVGLRAGDFADQFALTNMRKQLADSLSATRGFAGFALHNYRDFRTLMER